MMHVEKPGLIVAPLTPFTADLDVDEGALRREIDYVVRDCRATMVVAAGVETQEYTYLSLEQRKALIRHTIACVACDGRNFASLLQDRDRAGALCGKSGRSGGAIAGAAASICRAAHAGRPDPVFRGDWAREQASDRALSQSRAGRRRLHCGHDHACETAAR